MSQLRQVISSGIGQPIASSKLTWSDTVHIVVELTIKAYQAMFQEVVAQRDWEENVFTIRLGDDYLHRLALDHEYPLIVNVRQKRHTSKMKTGEQSTTEAKEIDMLLYGNWENYHEKHFVWEAKRIGDKSVDQKYSSLNSEYINEGIYRFIQLEYADGLDDAGMLGYVLDGVIGNIVNDINQTMSKIRKKPRLPLSNHLQMIAPINNFQDVYQSYHTRTDNTTVKLHHLFLAFNFS